MENNSIQIISFNFKSLQDHLTRLDTLVGGNDLYSYKDFDNFDDLCSLTDKNPNSFYIFNIESKNDFVFISKLLRDLNKRGATFKGICFFNFDNPKAENILLKQGISHVLDSDTTTKNFEFKVSMLLRAFEKELREDMSDLEFRKVSKEVKSEPEAKKKDAQRLRDAEFSETLNLDDKKEEGCLLFKNKKELELSKFTGQNKSNQVLDLLDHLGDKGYLNLEEGEFHISLSGIGGLECRLSDFLEEEVVLEVVGDFDVKLGDEFSLKVNFVYDKCKIDIELDGNISNIEKYGENACYITLNLHERSGDKLEYFMSLYEKRQNSINQFIELAKGLHN